MMQRSTNKENSDKNWKTYEETTEFAEYLLHKSEDSSNRSTLETEVHSRLDRSYQKTNSIVSYFATSFLKKYQKLKNWKLEVWIDKEKTNQNPKGKLINCGALLRRPNKNNVYVKKTSQSLHKVVKETLEAMKKILFREESISQNRTKLSRSY